MNKTNSALVSAHRDVDSLPRPPQLPACPPLFSPLPVCYPHPMACCSHPPHRALILSFPPPILQRLLRRPTAHEHHRRGQRPGAPSQGFSRSARDALHLLRRLPSEFCRAAPCSSSHFLGKRIRSTLLFCLRSVCRAGVSKAACQRRRPWPGGARARCSYRRWSSAR